MVLVVASVAAFPGWGWVAVAGLGGPRVLVIVWPSCGGWAGGARVLVLVNVTVSGLSS